MNAYDAGRLSPEATWAMFAVMVIGAVAVGMLIAILAERLARHVGVLDVEISVDTSEATLQLDRIQSAFDRYHIAWWNVHRDEIA